MAENVFEDKALQQYLNEIAKIPTLSREDEHDYAVKAKQGNQQAIEMLTQSNLKFVVKIASKYQNRGLTLSELISEGNVGLIKAIEKFDPTKDIKLISYGVWWIRQRILFALAEKTNVIRMPLGKTNIANKIRSVKESIYNKTGHKATVPEIVKEANIDEKAYNKLFHQTNETVSMDDVSYTSNSDTVSLKEFLEDKQSVDPKTLYYKEKLQDEIEHSIDKLPSRAAYIIKSYFGLEGKNARNFAQIAEELGLSRERVRQIQKSALEEIYKGVVHDYKEDIDTIINY